MSNESEQKSPEKELEERLRALLQLLVNNPEQVRIVTLVGESTVSYEIQTAIDDVGQIIGKGGKTIAAIRQLVKVASAKNKKRSLVSVLE